MFKSWTKKHTILAIIPLVLLLIGMFLLAYFNLPKHINLQFIQEKRADVFLFINAHPILSPVAFTVFYILSVCLVLPDAAILNFLAGMFFPFPLALSLVVFSETMGTLLFFLVVRLAFQGSFLQKKYFHWKTAKKKFKEGPASYLLFFRFSHLLPAWLVSALAVTFKANIWTFIWTTAVGLFPFMYLSVTAGHSFENSLNHGSLDGVHLLDSRTKLLFLALAVLALLPLLIKKFLHRKKF